MNFVKLLLNTNVKRLKMIEFSEKSFSRDDFSE